jgi:hypothetical protein
MVVRASAESTRAALSRSQPLRSLLIGLEALGLGDRVAATLGGDAGSGRVAGVGWSFDGPSRGNGSFEELAAPGHAKVAWSVTVRPHGKESSLLTVRVRAAGTDEESQERLRQAWADPGPAGRERDPAPGSSSQAGGRRSGGQLRLDRRVVLTGAGEE